MHIAAVRPLQRLMSPSATQLRGQPIAKEPRASRNASLREIRLYGADASFSRIQFWPLQNSPPRTQPSTRNISALLSTIVAA
jgi:hypothetical protein